MADKLDPKGLEAARKATNLNSPVGTWLQDLCVNFTRAYLSAASPAAGDVEGSRVQGMVRSMDQWRNMEPSAVAAGSRAQVEYALTDAKTDIQALWVKLASLSDSPAAEPVAGKGEVTHRHKKRGTEYVLIGIGRMQCDWWQIAGSGVRYPVDMREVAIYRGVDDSSLWVRPREEFEDGRFEALAAAPSPVGQEGGEG